MSEDAAQAVIAAAERVVTAVQARSTVALVTLAHRVQSRLDADAEDFRAHTGKGMAYQSAGDQIVPSMVAPALRIATRTAASRLSADHALVSLPATLAAYWAGDLERHRAYTLADHAMALPPEVRDRYEAGVLESTADPTTGEELPISDKVRDMPRSTLSRRAAKIARAVDPDCARTEAERAREERTVRAWAAEVPGSTRWEALLPADTSARMWSAVDALASQYARANPGMRIDAARADALADLVLANASVTTTVTLLVPALPLHASIAHVMAGGGACDSRSRGLTASPLSSLPPPEHDSDGRHGHRCSGDGGARQCEHPGERWEHRSQDEDSKRQRQHAGAITWILAGAAEDPKVGALLPETVAAILADPATLVRLAWLDTDGSLATSPRTHDPGAALRRAIQTRDGTCRFPGCHTPARRCDLDHVIEFPAGPTEPSNLAALCRTHHVFKHHGGWTTSMGADAVLRWTTPDGRIYTTYPKSAQFQSDVGLDSLLLPTNAGSAADVQAVESSLIALASLVEPTPSESAGPADEDTGLALDAASDEHVLGPSECLAGASAGAPSPLEVAISARMQTTQWSTPRASDRGTTDAGNGVTQPQAHIVWPADEWLIWPLAG